MNLPISIIVASVLFSLSMYWATPRYMILPVGNSANPAVWRLDTRNGDVSLCATASGKDTESGCTAKMKQF